MLLQIIGEKGEISGYEIDQLVKKRGYREWADVGTTSIYIGLEKLRKKHLADSYIDTEKQGKGPLPKKFKINQKGIEVLKEEILTTLSSCRERERRFDLGIAGIPFVSPQDAIAALQKRKRFLSKAAKRIEEKFKQQGGEDLPLNVKAVFEHPIFLIKYELEFTDNLIKALRR
jgi:DNA-binding PadR family transcriptional regulator